MFYTWYYWWRDTIISLRRNSLLCLAAIGTTAISLFILGISVLVMLNVYHLAEKVESEVEITAFLLDKVDRRQAKEIEAAIASVPGVSHVQFVPREEALEYFKRQFGDKKDILAGLEKDNILPDAFRIKAVTVEQVPAVAEAVEKISGIEQVRYGRGLVEKLGVLAHWVRMGGAVAVLLLGMGAVFLIFTATRLSVFARRQEIEIMKMLGATSWYIRMPYILEGMIIGAAGALLAAVAVYAGYKSLLNGAAEVLPFLELVNDPVILLTVTGGMIVCGVLLGCGSSAVALRRFLRIT